MTGVHWPPVHPHPRAVLDALRTAYGLTETARCDYLTSGLHHTYLVRDRDQHCVCRVYRRAWRAPEACLYELDVLDQLGQQHCPVAHPLRNRHHELAIEADLGMGPATLAAFTYAQGAAPGTNLTAAQASQLGQATATLHMALGAVQPRYWRPPRDWAYLVDGPLDVLRAFLSAADHAQLCSDIARLQACMPNLATAAPQFGIVHGDINLKNVHFADERLTFIDFDDCGPGWYAYDIGKFFHACSALPAHTQLQSSFLQAYHATRALSAAERDAIPFFAAIAQLWIMGVHAYNADYLADYLSAEFWQRRMQGWRRLVEVAWKSGQA